MDRLIIAVLVFGISLAARTPAFAQQAIASSDVLSQISMFSYREGKKSDINFRAGLRFMVEGHTDNTGTVAANSELSLRRAIAVRDYLINQGVAASSTDVAGLGSSRPVADNATADGRARNRRVEIVVAGGPIETGRAAAAR